MSDALAHPNTHIMLIDMGDRLSAAARDAAYWRGVAEEALTELSMLRALDSKQAAEVPGE